MSRATKLSKAKLEELIEDATIDAHDEGEQATGFFTMMENELEIPFTITVLGIDAQVKSIDLTNDDRIVAVCHRGREKQRICLVDLPPPTPRPSGWQWVEAYIYWRSRF